MTNTMRRRWSDNDRYLGPFTYARDKRYRPLAVLLSSGCDEYPGCQIRLSGFGHTLIVGLPQWVVRPYREKVSAKSWDQATIERLGRDWYWSVDKREFGFSYSEGFLQVYRGRHTMDSSTDTTWSKFLPWTQWRHVRHSLYGLDGKHVWTEPQRTRAKGDGFDSYRVYAAAKEQCPARTFTFTDYDGEALTAKTLIEEREWRFGTGWFKWLSAFRRRKVSRSLDIRFSGETGKRKGSWKGGTVGHSIEMEPGELHEAAFRRYCVKHDMTFSGAL